MKDFNGIASVKNQGFSIEKIGAGEQGLQVVAKVEGKEIASIGYGLSKWDEDSYMVHDVVLQRGNWKDPRITETLTMLIDILKAEGRGAVSMESDLFSNDDTDHEERDEVLAAVGFVKDESSFPGSVKYYYNMG